MEARSARRARRGLFVTLEGPDGAGKSSQAERLVAHLRAAGHAVTAVREPGGTPLADLARDHLMAAIEHDPRTDALLFNAARADLVRTVIRPALVRGEIVVGDRHTDSTLAYQGYGSGLDLDDLRRLNAFATGHLAPDLTVLLDLPVSAGLARRAVGAPDGQTRFEDPTYHDRAFHERVRHGYLTLAAAEPMRWRVVDGNRPPAAIAAEVSELVDAWAAQAATPGRPRSEPASGAVRIKR